MQTVAVERPPELQRAWAYGYHTQLPTLRQVKRPPEPSSGQVLIRVHAASLNPIDHITASGAHAALFSFRWPRVYGFDFCGAACCSLTLLPTALRQI